MTLFIGTEMIGVEVARRQRLGGRKLGMPSAKLFLELFA